jgi:hypothetical protein
MLQCQGRIARDTPSLEILTSIPSEVALDMGEKVDERKALNVIAENFLKIAAVRLVELGVRGHVVTREIVGVYSVSGSVSRLGSCKN